MRSRRSSAMMFLFLRGWGLLVAALGAIVKSNYYFRIYQ